jgi:hypothetical protein
MTTVKAMRAIGAVGIVAILAADVLSAQEPPKPAAPAPKAYQSPLSREDKIRNISSAAPSSIVLKATILDWPAKAGDPPPVLRAGSNGWTCFPDNPATKGNDPMCLDESWMTWLAALQAHKTPEITHVGVAYMMTPGGVLGSNADPYAKTETPSNQWGLDGPRIMIVVPDQKDLAGLPTDRSAVGTFVRYAGTPYAHIVIPTATPPAAPAAGRGGGYPGQF